MEVLPMNVVRRVLIGSVCLIGATSVYASESAELRVKGIISPAACTPSFSGIIDYGYIDPKRLNPTAETRLPEKQLSYTINCAAPVTVATTWVDARKGTESDGHDPLLNDIVFGLGLQGSNKIGKYFVKNDTSITADGQPVDTIYQLQSGGAWQNDGDRYQIATNTIHAYATPGTLIPGSYSSIASAVKIDTYIAPTENLDMSKNVVLDGLATMTMRYL
ncbi:DUF1120 domain-containing protein [Pseudomonas defluvii]|uniref:DUF1120 domain-containing protein n=1 Tax=Pseudomonas defluvii TaxID=1876757 RepID=UPI003905C475